MGDRPDVAWPRRRRSSAEEPSDSRQIRELGSALGLRIMFDDDGLPVIPGRYGQIESFDRGTLAVYTRHPRLFRRLWAIRGVQPHQTGDTEMPRGVPGRSIGTGRQRHQGLASTHPLTRGSPPPRLQAHTQSDFRAVEATMHGHRGFRVGRHTHGT